MSTITIYHNPAFGTSRNVLGLIRNSGEEPTIIEYLKTPPDRDTLQALIAAMGVPVRAVLREKGVSYTSPNSLAMITGWGQSMEGTINDKDPLIVDKGVNEFAGDGIYVLTWHEHLYIKRVQVMDAERFWLISDNAKHKDQEARIEDVTIHAKVLMIWNARKA